MKVFILSNDDLTSNIIFEPLFSRENIQIVGVAFSKNILSHKKNFLQGVFSLLKKVDFYYWIYQVFINSCYKINEFIYLYLNKRAHNNWLIPIRVLCKQRNIPVYSVADINCTEFCTIVRESGADLIVIRINQILKADLLCIPRLGVWCVHSSILPSYRGIAAEFHALRLNETRLGTSIFKVDIQLDKGPSLFQVDFVSLPNQSVFSHMLYNNHLAGKMLSQAVAQYATGKLEPHLLTYEVVSSYHSWPKKGQVKELNQTGYKLMKSSEIIKLFGFCVSGKGNFIFSLANCEKI